jgi:hypothetical protein
MRPRSATRRPASGRVRKCRCGQRSARPRRSRAAVFVSIPVISPSPLLTTATASPKIERRQVAGGARMGEARPRLWAGG